MNLAPVTVNGYTKYGSENVGGISIQFLTDGSVKNNTAVESTSTSNETGYYEVELSPGSYNISAVKINGYTIVYSSTDQLEVSMGEGTKAHNIILTKKSITVSGNTKYESWNVKNITIDFEPTIAENNTAKSATTNSNKNGVYDVELAPGSYSVSVNETINESGKNVTYTFTGTLEIKDTDVSRSFDIPLARRVES